MADAMKKMPALFVGHGSNMNAIEDNDYTRNWAKIVSENPKPKQPLLFLPTGILLEVE